jgi:hypothetical protein
MKIRLLGPVLCSILYLGVPLPTLGVVQICPNEMEIGLPKDIELPPGWERMGTVGSKQGLKQVELYDGHPDFYPEVRPQKRQANQTHWEFRLTPNSKLPVRAVWVKCKYGEQLFNLLRPLPPHFKFCDLNCDNACQLVCK